MKISLSSFFNRLGPLLVHMGPLPLISIGMICSPIPVTAIPIDQPPGFVQRVVNQSEPGSGFFLRIGNQNFFITAKHVLGGSGETVQVILQDGRLLDIPISKQLPIAGIDLAIVPLDDTFALGSIASPASSQPVAGENLTVWGYPVDKQKININLSSRSGSYIGVPTTTLDGYELLYAASTQVGFSGGPILNKDGSVVGIHGRSESRSTSNGLHERTGKALGIPMSVVLARLGSANSHTSNGSIVDISSLQKDAARISLAKVAQILANSSLSDQVLSELGRAEEGKAPRYCLDLARSYYYAYYSELPDLAKAKQSLTLSNSDKGVPAIYFALGSLISKKSGDFNQSLKLNRLAEQSGGSDFLQFSERRLKNAIVDEVLTCAKTGF